MTKAQTELFQKFQILDDCYNREHWQATLHQLEADCKRFNVRLGDRSITDVRREIMMAKILFIEKQK
jgi:predicted DNA binding CopG/RHH family protein